jgi:hypothetical protein
MEAVEWAFMLAADLSQEIDVTLYGADKWTCS